MTSMLDLAVRNSLVLLVVTLVARPSNAVLTAAERAFTHRIAISVPARGAFGAPPKREESYDFVLPANFSVIRGGENFGVTIQSENLGGLTETARVFEEIPNGARIKWALKNEHSFPAAGRKAFLVVEVKGTRSSTTSLSPKYELLRKRFFEQFYFSGLVAERTSNDGKEAKFADQTIYMGQALMMLSTEAAILRDNGKPVAETLAKITEILDAFDRLDKSANIRYGGDSTTTDGFFVRDDIEGEGDTRLGNRFTKVESDWQDENAENDTPSGDQIFGMLGGLYCVAKYSGDEALAKRAKRTAARLYEYARSSYFVLELPDGDATRRGSDMRWLASLLHGVNKATTGEDNFGRSRIKVAGVRTSLNGIAAFWDQSSTARNVERLTGEAIQIPIVDEELELNGFALHILLMALAPSEVWSKAELEKAATKANHHLSALVYAHSHSTTPDEFDEKTIQEILNACPNDGPRADLPTESGWQRDNRWVRCTSVFDANEGNSHFNGVDWLVLHNFHQLVYAGD